MTVHPDQQPGKPSNLRATGFWHKALRQSWGKRDEGPGFSAGALQPLPFGWPWWAVDPIQGKQQGWVHSHS